MEDTTKHCTPCKTKDKEIKPEYYCMDCEAYYCEECFELHPRVPYLAKHIVLKHDDIDIWSRDQYKCSTHSKNLEFFCKEHKMLCCHVCVSLKHRSCTNMDYIQEEAMKKCLDDDKEKMMKQIEEQLKIIESSFDKVKRKTETNQTSKIAYIDEMESFRSRINAVFNSLVEKAFEEMNETYEKNTKYSENVSEKLVCFKGKLKNHEQQIQSSTVGKEALVYISLQRGEELIEEISRELSKIDFSVVKEKYKPVIDGKIEGYVKGFAQIAVLEDDKMREECIASDIYTEGKNEVNTVEDSVKEKSKRRQIQREDRKDSIEDFFQHPGSDNEEDWTDYEKRSQFQRDRKNSFSGSDNEVDWTDYEKRRQIQRDRSNSFEKKPLPSRLGEEQLEVKKQQRMRKIRLMGERHNDDWIPYEQEVHPNFYIKEQLEVQKRQILRKVLLRGERHNDGRKDEEEERIRKMKEFLDNT